jgi:hypothetical protein
MGKLGSGTGKSLILVLTKKQGLSWRSQSRHFRIGEWLLEAPAIYRVPKLEGDFLAPISPVKISKNVEGCFGTG